MDDSFPAWPLPAWIIGAPVMVVAVDPLRTPVTARSERDWPMPWRTSALRSA